MSERIIGAVVAEGGHVTRYECNGKPYYVFWPGIKKGKPKAGGDDGDLTWVKATLEILPAPPLTNKLKKDKPN